ncbi:MAG: Ig-like domain-containing protein [Gemmatimonadota bacterium]|nr:Ig-like domain-containing protein [Gemmatimonadota bacterium]
MMSRRAGPVMLLGALLAACGGGSDSNPATTIARTSGSSGDAQTATVATALPIQLSVTVTEDGAAKAGATVTWSTVAGSGTVAPTSAVTNASGIATTTSWTLGTLAGAQTARATLAGAGGSPVSFTATGTAGAATAFTKNAGDGQSASPSAAFVTALAVKLADAFGNGVSGITVNWAVQSGSATVAAASSVTNASGVATIGATAGATAGPAVVRATNGSVAGNLDFALTVVALPLTRAVTASDFRFTSSANATFNQAIDTIGVGGTVTWTATSATIHFVESTGSPSFTNGGNISTGGTTSSNFTFNTAGTYTYVCGIHPSMTGRVVVK